MQRLPRAILFDPERIGFVLQRLTRVDDFQDLRAWRRMTILGLRLTRWLYPNIVVPMAFSNVEYLEEIRAGIRRFEPRLAHFCLIAPIEVVQERLRQRRTNPRDEAWQFRRAAECCAVHHQQQFATHVRADQNNPDEIAQQILAAIDTL